MNEQHIPCSPCQVVVLQEVTDDPEVASTGIIIDYPIGIIDIYQDGEFLSSQEYDTCVPV